MVKTRHITAQLKKYFYTWGQKDPITLAIVNRTFTLIRNGVKVPYDAKTLYEFIKKTGDFKDPVTRTEYNICELSRLERLNKKERGYLSQNKHLLEQHRHEFYTLLKLCDSFEI
jgi:hypothetical protein